MAMFCLRYDMRNRPGGPVTTTDLYGAMLESCEWGDRVGADTVVISEHHGSSDGYLPAPLAAAGAIVGRTERIPVTVAAVLAPLNDPIRMAEELVVLDHISKGRVWIVLGAGYRHVEFEMYGADRSKRGPLMEEFATALLNAFNGEPFTYRGRSVQVTPTPYSKPHPIIMMGGSQAPSARRAARLHIPYFPAIGDPELAKIYYEEAAKVGYETPYCSLPTGPGFIHVSNDPERDWARLLPYMRHTVDTYMEWQTPDVRSAVHVEKNDDETIRKSGVFAVVTPEECLKLADEVGPYGTLILHPLLSGMPPEWGFESLDLFEKAVLPKLARPHLEAQG